MDKKLYIIEVNYLDGNREVIRLETNDIEWSMDEYQRNRTPLQWQIIEQ